MLINENKSYQEGLILTDNFSPNPILDFENYKNTIVNVIKKSDPNFSIGIFGEWGTGKTSLMKSIERHFLDHDSNNIKTIWFDAWKYEHEQGFALIPLLKKINFSLDEDQYKNLKKALREAAIFSLEISSDIISSTVTNFSGGVLGGLSQNIVAGGTRRLISKLNEVDKNGIFYNGIDNIQKEITKLRITNDKRKIDRFVIFIDDLDRCSTEKVLEILESIKIFLSLEGIIYILGISHETIANLIAERYKINGERYLRKMIQIPIMLPEWTSGDVELLIQHFLDKKMLNEKYSALIGSNKDLISTAVENNPREVKRFINNYIISNEIHSQNKEIKEKELLLVQAINLRWNSFYRLLVQSSKFLEQLKPILDMSEEMRINFLNSEENKEGIDYGIKLILRNFKSDEELWSFLKKHSPTLFEIKNWEVYRRAMQIVPSKDLESNEQLAKLFDILHQIVGNLVNTNSAPLNAKAERLFSLSNNLQNKFPHLKLDIENKEIIEEFLNQTASILVSLIEGQDTQLPVYKSIAEKSKISLELISILRDKINRIKPMKWSQVIEKE